ncbi:hypothetical protein F5I97DRAFT_386300 [Phlebopus sp. FC_14]|nr:hypothetical protein F5I97DRAFT_386300 [Phlebopus sp. FC_14]
MVVFGLVKLLVTGSAAGISLRSISDFLQHDPTGHSQVHHPFNNTSLGQTHPSGQPDVSGTGFLPTVVCPGRADSAEVYSKFVIAKEGYYKYNFLPCTVCVVTPLVTTVRADYADGGIINASQIITSRTFDETDSDLLSYLAGVANYHARTSQGVLNSIIGDTLYSLYSGQFNIPITNNTDGKDHRKSLLAEPSREVASVASQVYFSSFVGGGTLLV